MRLPGWLGRLPKLRRSTKDAARRHLMEPVRLSVRRLEERRVLDASAVFNAAGELSLLLSSAGDQATIGMQNGQIVITDRDQSVVEIKDQNGVATAVAVDDVQSLELRGNSAADQAVRLEVALAPADGARVASSLETLVLHENVTSAADLEFGSDVVLSNDVTLTGADVRFQGRIDDDGDATSGSSLTVNATGTTTFIEPVGLRSALDRLQSDAAGQTRLAADVAASGGTVVFHDPVQLAADVTLSDAGPTGIIFHSTVDGPYQLTLDAPNGRVAFNGNLGAHVPLAGLTVVAAGDGIRFGESTPVAEVRSTGAIDLGAGASPVGGVHFNAGVNQTMVLQTTGDDVRINGAVFLISDLRIDTGLHVGDIRFTADAPIDSQSTHGHDLTLHAGRGAVAFNADLGATHPLGRLQVERADAGVTFGEADADTGPGGQGPVETVNLDGGLNIGVGSTPIQGAGIILNAGAADLLITSKDADVRFNGPLTLASHLAITTGAGAGDVVFTNDTPVDSESGRFFELHVDAGSGAVRFNEDLGNRDPVANTALGRLIVSRAAGGVLFGESITEVPGAGSTGPVDFVRLRGDLDIGAGGEVIGGAGIVLTGGAANGMQVASSEGGMRWNGRVSLANHVRFETRDGGDIRFTYDAPIDGVTGRVSDLVLNASSGQVVFNQDVGRQVALGALTIERAGGGVRFGGASTGTAGSGGAGPVTAVRAVRGIDVGVGTHLIGGSGIDLNGGAVGVELTTDGQQIRFNGPVNLQSDLRLSSGPGPGDIMFTSGAPIDSNDGPESGTANERNRLVIAAGGGRVTFGANLGQTQQLGDLIIETAAGGVAVGSADVPTPGGAGPVTVVDVEGAIQLGSAVSTTGVIRDGIRLHAGPDMVLTIQSHGHDVRFNGPVQIDADVVIETGGGNLTFTDEATVDSQAGETPGLTIDVGAGNATWQAAIGGMQMLGDLRIRAARDLRFAGPVSVASLTQQAGSGETLFEGTLTTSSAAGIDLVGNDFTFAAPVRTTSKGTLNIFQSGTLDLQAGASLDLDGAFVQQGGVVLAAADLVTHGEAITFGGAVMLAGGGAAEIRMASTGAGHPAGASIVFNQSLDGGPTGTSRLQLDAGSNGDVQFDGAVGENHSVGTLQIERARDVVFSERLIVGRLTQDAGHGKTRFEDTVLATSSTDKALDLATVDVAFLDAVTTQGDGRVEVTVSGQFETFAAADMMLAGAFLQDGGGRSLLAGDIVTDDADLTFTDPVTIRQDLQLQTGSGKGTISFLSTVNGTTAAGQPLTLQAGQGDIRFAGALGDMTLLGDVTIRSAHDVALEQSIAAASLRQQAGTGETHFAAPVTITGPGGVDLTTASVRIDDRLDSSAGDGSIQVIGSADLVAQGKITSGSGSVMLQADGNMTLSTTLDIVTEDGPVTLTADADGTAGGRLTMEDGAAIDTGAADLILRAGGDVSIGTLLTTGLVTITSRDGAIVDAGDDHGVDIVADRVALRASLGIGTDDPLDVQVRRAAAWNQGAGGVRLSNQPGAGETQRQLTIGTVDGLHGFLAGPAAPADLGGEIEIVNIGGIDVGASIQNNAGGHTRLRAEFAGDLNVNQPIQNRGGNGWITLFAAGDLNINDSLPEWIDDDPQQPFPEAEISVQHEGAVRGQAGGRVIVANGRANYVIIRTHAERFPDPAELPTLPDKFADPTDFPEDDPAFYAELDAALAAQRNAVAAQVTNVAPIFSIEAVDQGGSNLDEQARGILQITIGSEYHLERNFHVTVDWGDGNIENYTIPGNTRASDGFILADGTRSNRFPDATITASFDSGQLQADGSRAPGVYYLHHTYLEPPDLGDPSAPIPVATEIRYDARSAGGTELDLLQPASGSAIFNGIRFYENLTQEVFSTAETEMTNPGRGAFTFIKVIESEIIPVEVRKVATAVVTNTTVAATSAFGEQLEFVTAQFELQETGDYRLFFRVVDDATQVEFGDFTLPNTAISDPIGALIKEYQFPNGHYRIYLEDLRTSRTRLFLEVHLYEGRVVPRNFRQGATERQPGSDAVEKAVEDLQPDAQDGTSLPPAHETTTASVRNTQTAEEPAPGGDQPPGAQVVAGGAATILALGPLLRRRRRRPPTSPDRLDRTERLKRRLRRKWKP